MCASRVARPLGARLRERPGACRLSVLSIATIQRPSPRLADCGIADVQGRFLRSKLNLGKNNVFFAQGGLVLIE